MTIVFSLKSVLFCVGILANILLYIAIISGRSPITGFNHFSFIGKLNEQDAPEKFLYFYPFAALADLILIYVALFICTIVLLLVSLILVIVLVILSMPFIALLIK